jgi:hypothetical protein
MRLLSFRLLPLFVLLSGAANAGTLLNWTLSGNLTGMLASAPFSEAAFTFTFVVDTATLTNPSSGVWVSAAPTPGTFSITGVGSGSFNSTDNDIFQNANGGVTGMGISFSSDMLDVTAPGLFGWNLQSAFGPASVNATSSPNFSIGTTAGNLQVNGADTLVFSATLVTGTPEPAGAALVLLGMMLLGALAWRRPALVPVRRRRR